MKHLMLLFACLFVISCSSKKNTTGQYVKEIKQNVIYFEDGNRYKLDHTKGSKTIYMVRHAEKDTSGTKNPMLTEQGLERSYRLAQIFKGTRIDAVYSTLYNRTMHTVDSLAQMKGLSTDIYQPKDLKLISDKMMQDSINSVFIVSGHSNTTPALSGVLMGERQFEKGFDESDYENMLVYNKRADGKMELLKLKYR